MNRWLEVRQAQQAVRAVEAIRGKVARYLKRLGRLVQVYCWQKVAYSCWVDKQEKQADSEKAQTINCCFEAAVAHWASESEGLHQSSIGDPGWEPAFDLKELRRGAIWSKSYEEESKCFLEPSAGGASSKPFEEWGPCRDLSNCWTIHLKTKLSYCSPIFSRSWKDKAIRKGYTGKVPGKQIVLIVTPSKEEEEKSQIFQKLLPTLHPIQI